MVNLSLDMSSTSSGYSLWDDEVLLQYGCIKNDDKNIYKRIEYMGIEINKLVVENSVKQIYAEEVPPIANNTTTVIALGMVKGYVLSVANHNNIGIKYIPVGTWRKEIEGMYDGTKEGKERLALKKKSIEIVNNLYGLELIYKSPYSKENQDDISDSVLIYHSIIHPKPKSPKSKPTAIKTGFGKRV